MHRLAIVHGGILLFLALASPVRALNTTVGLADAVRLEPLGAPELLGVRGIAFSQAAESNHYTVIEYVDQTFDLNQVLTLPALATLLANGYGMWWANSHADANAWVVESYPPNQQGVDAWNAAMAQYSSLYPPDEFFGKPILNGTDVIRYDVIITPSFVSRRFHNVGWPGSFVSWNGCNSSTFSDAFWPRLAFLGYTYPVDNTVVSDETITLFRRMMGLFGNSMRRLGDALGGLTIWSTGSPDVVFAPAVESVTLTSGAVIGCLGCSINGEVNFDCSMDMNGMPAASIVQGIGPIQVTSAAWRGSSLISFVATTLAEGQGAIAVKAFTYDYPTDPGARSEYGLIGLDGNSVPANDANPPDGGPREYWVRAPNEDDFNLHVVVDVVPEAFVEHFSAVGSAGQVHVGWDVAYEQETATYLVERGPSWSGPFTLAATMPASGLKRYEVFDGFTGDSVYRLREVEAGGDTLVHAMDKICPPYAVTTGVTPTLDADSLRAAQLALYPTLPSPPDDPAHTAEWICIAPQAIMDAAVPLANFWTTRGHPAAVKSLETVQSLGGVKMYLRDLWLNYHRLRYVLLAGDANDYDWWTNDALWVNGWTRPSWPVQPGNDVIPLSHYQGVGVDNPLYSISSTTPYWGNDWRYAAVDVDEPNLPAVAIGRAPVGSMWELTYFVQKTISAAGMATHGGYLDHVGVWVYGRDEGTHPGASAVQAGDSLCTYLPLRLIKDKLYDIPGQALSWQERWIKAKAAFDQGRSLVITMGSVSTRYSWAWWVDQTRGWSWQNLVPTSTLPFLLGASCNIANIDETEDPTYGVPPLQQAMAYPSRGPWGAFGPTRGAWQHAHYLLAREFIRVAYSGGVPSAGEAARRAMRNVLAAYPQYADAAQSYIFIGDPLVPLPNMENPVAGGCPVVDVLADSGWVAENTVLGRSVNLTFLSDNYRVKSIPAPMAGHFAMRLRENESEYTALDEAHLVAVDHPPDVRAYAFGDRVLLGSRIPPERATTQSGVDATKQLDGSGGGFFVGEPGETLLVELGSQTPQEVGPSEPGSLSSPDPDGLDPFEIDPGDKGGGGGGLLAGETPTTGKAQDVSILNSTGILVQGRDLAGVWQTVRKLYPRENFDETAVDTLDKGQVRLVFVGRHNVRFVGRIIPSGFAKIQPLRLLGARHTRLGDVSDAIRTADGTVAELDPGDTLNLQFASRAPATGMVQDLFLFTKGVYSSARISQNDLRDDAVPTQFELFQNQPNPFEVNTIIRFALPKAEPVRLEIYDVQGRRVATLADAQFPPGYHSVAWQGEGSGGHTIRAGVYLYRLRAGPFEARKKLVVLR